MRRIIIAAALLAAIITTAHADDNAVAEGIFALGLYNRDCAKVPADKMAMIEPMLAEIPRDVMLAAIQRVGDFYRSVGTTKFCAIWKVKIEQATADYNR